MPTVGEEEMLASNMPCPEGANIMSEATSGASRRRRRRSSSDELLGALKEMADGLGELIESASTIISSSFDKLTDGAYMVQRKEGLYA